MSHDSKLQSVLRASGSLPPPDKDLFRRLFTQHGPEEKVAQGLGITMDELELRKSRMLKTLLKAA